MVQFLRERGAAINIKTHYGGSVWDFVGKEPRWTAGGTTPEDESWGRSIREMLEAGQKAEEAAVAAQALMQAVQNNDLAEVKRLNANQKTPVVGSPGDGQTPLLVACFNGSTEIVRELIDAGANPRIVDYLLKATPAHKAAFSGHPGPLKLLIGQGVVELNAQGPYNGYTALHDSVWHGHTEYDLAVALGYDRLAELILAKMQSA